MVDDAKPVPDDPQAAEIARLKSALEKSQWELAKVALHSLRVDEALVDATARSVVHREVIGAAKALIDHLWSQGPEPVNLTTRKHRMLKKRYDDALERLKVSPEVIGRLLASPVESLNVQVTGAPEGQAAEAIMAAAHTLGLDVRGRRSNDPMVLNAEAEAVADRVLNEFREITGAFPKGVRMIREFMIAAVVYSHGRVRRERK